VADSSRLAGKIFKEGIKKRSGFIFYKILVNMIVLKKPSVCFNRGLFLQDYSSIEIDFEFYLVEQVA
jgi:hypothetical protein